VKSGRLVTLAMILLFLAGSPRESAGRVIEAGRLKVLGLSLLVPGLGHWRLGERDRAYAFMGAEATVWGSYSVFRVQAKLRQDSYVEMAELFAGVDDASGRSDSYYRRLGAYRSSDLYDEEIRREARQVHPNDLEARERYFDRHRVPVEQQWSWSSTERWDRYRTKRNDSNRALKKADYMLGVALANRLLAAVDAIRIYSGHSASGKMSMRFAPDAICPDDGARLVLTYRIP